jgi:phage major head subunit gpT-like protein
MSGKLLDRAKLDAAYITFSTLFDMQLTRTPVIFQEIATVIPVATTEVQFKWLGDVPTMKKWIGQRAINKLRAETHRIVTENWANGIEVHKDEIADDQLSLVQPRIADLADQGMFKMEDLIFDLLNGGIQSTTLAACYDGEALLDTDHTADGAGTGASQSNFEDLALSATTYQNAWKKMMDFVDTTGESIRVVPDTLLVGTANRTVARNLIVQETKANGESNIEAGSARLIVHPRVTGTNWFLMSTKQAVRALILLVRQAPQFASVASMDDYNAFMQGNFLYGADARFGAGLGLWQTIVGGDGA